VPGGAVRAVDRDAGRGEVAAGRPHADVFRLWKNTGDTPPEIATSIARFTVDEDRRRADYRVTDLPVRVPAGTG